jgi:hypothetical protein
MDMVTADGDLLRGSTLTLAPGSPRMFTFVEKINDVPLSDHLKGSITALVAAANGDAQQARLNIEGWFNSSMDRVSGWCKSRTQMILFSVGVAVTVAVNADSIAIFRNLSHSKNLQAVVGAAQKASSERLPPGQDPQAQIDKAMDQLNRLDIGIGWAKEVEQSGGLARTKLPPSLDRVSCTTEKGPCNDPIGWSIQLLYWHGIGWLITAAAIALGAPFWFDTLNRFMVVRSTVKPKEKSPDEASKD